ncbi:MAG: phosphoribosylanthranilate isomerase [Pelagibacteraceae bacterium]|jgi:phosphoribosylanthranilate isomerase|nr:phosphoribosylanthranilate isomerase [Pelagibacteraceae bacterium]MCH2376752.1 phosphoribosylanthranilate isomerase [Pelagibacterales bacterium]|tara:strand:+ start:754 stop:1368 length:615 start_codon:yes stop_codon:yes gene_type:complete
MLAKICGLAEKNQVKTCLEYGASMCGFILFYPKSHRNLSLQKVSELTSIKNSKSNVAVMVEPSKSDLEKIKDLNFQYYQIYGNQDPAEINEIKKKNNVKIIKALTIETGKDVLKYKKYEAVSDIILFDSIGREKSLSFDHSLLKDVPKNVIKMIAGNIQVQDLEKISKIADIVDVSGAVETEKKKDLTKIKEFLLKIKEINELN